MVTLKYAVHVISNVPVIGQISKSSLEEDYSGYPDGGKWLTVWYIFKDSTPPPPRSPPFGPRKGNKQKEMFFI